MNQINLQTLDRIGVYLQKGGDHQIWAFPPRKEPDYTDWHEVTLRDADLTSPPDYEPKRFTMAFVVLRPTAERMRVARGLFEPRSVDFYLGQLDQLYQLTPLRFTDYRHIGGLVHKAPAFGILEVEFEQQGIPALYRGIALPTEAGHQKSYITLDGVDLSAFGLVVRSVYDTALLPHALKRPKEVVASKSIAVECTMVATSADGIKGNMAALWRAIDKPGSRTLNIAGTSNRVYYTFMDEPAKLATFKEGRKCLIKFTIHFQTVKK